MIRKWLEAADKVFPLPKGMRHNFTLNKGDIVLSLACPDTLRFLLLKFESDSELVELDPIKTLEEFKEQYDELKGIYTR